MSGTTVYYNGVCLQDCLTTDWEHVVEYDESGYQAIANRFRITVDSTLVSFHNASSESTRTTNYHPSSVATARALDQSTSSVKQLAVDTLAEVDSLLSQNCMDFVMTIHDASTDANKTMPKGYFQRDGANRILLAATGVAKTNTFGAFGLSKLFVYDPQLSAASFTEIDILRHDVLDCDNGPKPQNVRITALTGARVFRVSVTFEICRPIISDWVADQESESYDPRKAKGVMKNRWSVTDSMDGDGAVSHRIRGTLAVSDIRYKANAMRLMAFPLAFPFAKLGGRENEVSEDGKTLGYTITYTHEGNAPPPGVRDYEAQYIEGASYTMKGGYYGAMSIKVKGWHHRSTDDAGVYVTSQEQKRILLRGATTILHSRIRGINLVWDPLPGQVPVKTLISQFRIAENVKKPELELMVQVHFASENEDKKELPVRLANLGALFDIPDYDPKWWPIDNEWGRLLNEDVNNVFLRSSYIPQSELGETEDIDYMNQQRHQSGEWAYMTPRITQLPVASTDIREHVPTSTSGTTPDTVGTISPDVVPKTPNPIPATTSFSAYLSRDLAGETVLSNEPLRDPGADGSGISEVQQSGFSYLSWKSEILNDSASGMIQLPLSRPRPIKAGSIGLSPSVTVVGNQTAVTVRLHAGKGKRIYSVAATRVGDWPELPLPNAMIVRYAPSSSSGAPIVSNVERLIGSQFIPTGPDLEADVVTNVYRIDARYEYSLDMTFAADEDTNGLGAGGSVFSSIVDLGKLEQIPVIKDPRTKATFGETSILELNNILKDGYIA